jgi:hypothetical protein
MLKFARSIQRADLIHALDAFWWRLTPEQLSIHVERNTVVAQWL